MEMNRVGPLADTLLELEETESKPIIDIKSETFEGPAYNNEKVEPGPGKTSSYFEVTKSLDSLIW